MPTNNHDDDGHNNLICDGLPAVALTADTVTDDDIQALQIDAVDDKQADLCRLALGITPMIAWNFTPREARRRCAEAINEARAQRDSVVRSYRIQTDEETGGDETWDALHDYADAHPAPAALAPFVDRNVGGNFTGVVVSRQDGEAASAWLDLAYAALGYDDRTTPVLVIPEEKE